MLKIHNMILGQHNDLLDQSLRCELLTGNQNFVRTSKTDSDQTVWMHRPRTQYDPDLSLMGNSKICCLVLILALF